MLESTTVQRVVMLCIIVCSFGFGEACREVDNLEDVTTSDDCVQISGDELHNMTWEGYNNIRVVWDGNTRINFESITLTNCTNISIEGFTFNKQAAPIITVSDYSHDITFQNGEITFSEEDNQIIINTACTQNNKVDFREMSFTADYFDKIKEVIDVKSGRLILVDSTATGCTDKFIRSDSKCADTIVTVDKFSYNSNTCESTKIFDCHDSAQFVVSNVLIHGDIKAALHAECDTNKDGKFTLEYGTFGKDITRIEEDEDKNDIDEWTFINSLVMTSKQYGPTVLNVEACFFSDIDNGDYRLNAKQSSSIFDVPISSQSAINYDIDGVIRLAGLEDIGAYQSRQCSIDTRPSNEYFCAGDEWIKETSCGGTQLTDFNCKCDTWVADDPVTILVPTLWNGTYVFNDDATINTTQTFADDSVLTFTACASVTGNIKFDSDNIKDNETRDVFLYSQQCAELDNINVEEIDKGCSIITGTPMDDKQGHFSVLFSVQDKCKQSSNNGLSPAAVAAIVIVILVLIAVVVIVVVGLKVPQLRSKITPFKRKTVREQAS